MSAVRMLAAGFAVLCSLVGESRAGDPGARPVESSPDTALERAVNAFNDLVLGGGPKALSCTIGSSNSSATTTCYYQRPLEKVTDSSYQCTVKWHVVSRQPHRSPSVAVYDNIMHLTMEGGQVVYITKFTNGRSTGASDVELVGNGFRVLGRGIGAGEHDITEYVRRRDGAVRSIQRYKGLPATVVYEQVPVPAELQAGRVRRDRYEQSFARLSL